MPNRDPWRPIHGARPEHRVTLPRPTPPPRRKRNADPIVTVVEGTPVDTTTRKRPPPPRRVSAAPVPGWAPHLRRRRRAWLRFGAAALLVALTSAGITGYLRHRRPHAPHTAPLLASFAADGATAAKALASRLAPTPPPSKAPREDVAHPVDPAITEPPFDRDRAARRVASMIHSAASRCGLKASLARASVTFAPSGRATQVLLKGNDGLTPEGQCVMRSLYRVQVPPFDGVSAEVGVLVRL